MSAGLSLPFTPALSCLSPWSALGWLSSRDWLCCWRHWLPFTVSCSTDVVAYASLQQLQPKECLPHLEWPKYLFLRKKLAVFILLNNRFDFQVALNLVVNDTDMSISCLLTAASGLVLNLPFSCSPVFIPAPPCSNSQLPNHNIRRKPSTLNLGLESRRV